MVKKTCNGCKAFNFDKECDLGYKIELINFQHIVINAKPPSGAMSKTQNNKRICRVIL